jgi:HAMP domain-containing protein
MNWKSATLDNVSIRTKLWVLVAVLALPIIALMATQFVSLQDSVDRVDKERAGVEFETKMLEFTRNVQTHRDQEMRVLGGNTSAQASLDQVTGAIDANLVELRALAASAGVASETRKLQSDWDGFKNSQRTTPVESFGAHTQFINEQAMQVFLTAATRSELFTDSELASRSIIQSLVTTLNMGEQVAQARSLAANSMNEHAGQEPTAAERSAISGYLQSAETYQSELLFQLNLAVSADPDLGKTLDPFLTKWNQSLLSFSNSVEQNYVNATVLDRTRAEGLYLLGASAVTAANDLVTAAANEMNAEFDSRAASATRQMQVVGGVAFLGIIVALLLAVLVSRSITRPVSHLAEVADRMSLGELDVEIDVHGSNEVGQLAESLRRMQASLRSAIERLRQRRAA